MQDAGAIAYEAGIRAIDQLGLNDKNVAHLPGRYYYREIADYVFASNPTYIVLLSRDSHILTPKTIPDTVLSKHQLFMKH